MPQANKRLPARPNLAHLKKQAKRRLRVLRRSDRTAKLADAQRAVAREYGFASWQKLSAQVQSSAQPAVDVETLARGAVGAMERGWAESFALIERRSDDRDRRLPRWEATDLQSPTLLEREADAWILERRQLGLYRITSLWHLATITATRRELRTIAPTRILEFFRGGDASAAAAAGAWRRIDWHPTRAGLTGKASRWDDLAEALRFLNTEAAVGEYRVITIRRMLRAERAKDRIKIIKKHAGVLSFAPLGIVEKTS